MQKSSVDKPLCRNINAEHEWGQIHFLAEKKTRSPGGTVLSMHAQGTALSTFSVNVVVQRFTHTTKKTFDFVILISEGDEATCGKE